MINPILDSGLDMQDDKVKTIRDMMLRDIRDPMQDVLKKVVTKDVTKDVTKQEKNLKSPELNSEMKILAKVANYIDPDDEVNTTAKKKKNKQMLKVLEGLKTGLMALFQ